MLKSIDKLSAILILLPLNKTHLNIPFRFYITELFSYLYCNISKNILFGFTNTSIINFMLGATKRPLNYILEELEIGITYSKLN